ncbi:MAG TPA: DNA-3-methyladenine glycosylase I [Chthoniobacteraceae bacterium]|nr:DNA-3-methyladenine glycosylase I [Chthoniobacteraceae bacterium]
MDNKKRCVWCPADDAEYVRYHDEEWGVPVHDDRLLFEMLILEGAQAGLSWRTILARRGTYRKAYDNFDARKIARYDARKVKALMGDTGIIRNRLKVAASIDNARAFLAVREEFGSFDKFIWGFTGGKTLVSRPKGPGDFQARTAESDAMSKELKKRGFRFVGSTICQAFMQAVGMRDDHMAGCFRAAKRKD